MAGTATRRLALVALTLAGLVVAAAAGCGSTGTGLSTSGERWSRPVIDPANFVAAVDNPYLPLVPGTTLVYRGVMKNGTTPQVDTFAVTRRTRQVMGVGCTVVRDTVTSRGRPVERTYDWFAQDRQGNVWYMGEETQELKHGQFGKMIDSGPAGKNGAQPGIMMEAVPGTGDQYWQFHWPGHALDKAAVLAQGRRVTVPYRSFSNALLTEERSPLEPGVRDRKWSVPGLGYVKERAATGTREQIRLVSVTRSG